jgi:hypothetical protein
MHRLKLIAAALALAAALGGTAQAMAGEPDPNTNAATLSLACTSATEGRIQVAPSRQSPLGGQNVADVVVPGPCGTPGEGT